MQIKGMQEYVSICISAAAKNPGEADIALYSISAYNFMVFALQNMNCYIHCNATHDGAH